MGVAVIVGTAKGAAVLRADDARERWSVEALKLPGWIVSTATRDAGGTFYLGVTSPIYGTVVMRSDDLEDWSQLEASPQYASGDRGNAVHKQIVGAFDFEGRLAGEQRHVDQIWRLLAAGDVLYAGVSEAGLFRSRDGGASWEALRGLNEHASRGEWLPGAGGLAAHAILADPGEPERLWAGISAAGVFRSDDGGETWEAKNEGVSRDEGYCVHGLARDASEPDLIYRQDHRGMYVTRDGGDRWEPIEDGLPVVELSDGRRCEFGFPVVVEPAGGAAYVVPLQGDSFRFPPEGRLRVYRTRDRGAHWEATGPGLPDDCYASVLRGAMAVDGLDPGGVYFGTTGGAVYASRDAGDSWLELPVTLPRVYSVAAFQV